MGKVEQGDVVKLNAMFTALDTDAAGRVDVGMLVARADAARERLEKSFGRPTLLPTHPGGRSGQRRASWRPTLLPSPRALKGQGPPHARARRRRQSAPSACPKALGEHTAPERAHGHDAAPAAHTGALPPPPPLILPLPPLYSLRHPSLSP